MNKEKIFFPNLDGLRSIAFLLVFFQHAFYNFFKSFEGESYLTDRLIAFLFLNGGTGVRIFFVLSGFLITYLILKEVKDNGKLNLGFFYLRRTLRIWPLYYAVVIFSFLVYPFFKSLLGIHSDLCSQPWYYFSFLANFDLINIAHACPGQDAMIRNIVWSVSIEEQFYLIWPILFVIVPQKHYWSIFPFILLVSISFKIFHLSDHNVLYYHTLSVISDLAIGGLLAFLSIQFTQFKKIIEEQKKIVIGSTYTIILLVLFFQDKIFVFKGAEITANIIKDFFWGYIIVEQNFAKNSPYKLKSLKVFTFWGKYTYGLYMLHPIAILFVDISFKLTQIAFIAHTVLLFKGIISFFLSLLLARISYRVLELPFLRLKEKFTIVKNKPLLQRIQD